MKSHLYGIEIIITYFFSVNRSKFKSHLYGIEISAHLGFKTISGRLNRTFMELKFEKSDKSHYTLFGLNRTFMELKFFLRKEHD